MTTMSAERIVELIRNIAALTRRLADDNPEDDVYDGIAASLEILLGEIED